MPCHFDGMARRMLEHTLQPLIESAVARGDIATAKRLAAKLEGPSS